MQNQNNPEIRTHRRCPPGAPRRPPGAPTGANCGGQMDACQKSFLKTKKLRIKQKHQKNGLPIGLGAAEGVPRRGPGEGPKSPGLIQFNDFFNKK